MQRLLIHSQLKRSQQWWSIIRSNRSTASLTMKQTSFFFFQFILNLQPNEIFLFQFHYIIFQMKVDLFLTLKPLPQKLVKPLPRKEKPPVWHMHIHLEALRRKLFQQSLNHGIPFFLWLGILFTWYSNSVGASRFSRMNQWIFLCKPVIVNEWFECKCRKV